MIDNIGIVFLLRNVDLEDKLLDDLRGCGDFLGIDVGKKLGICTRKNTKKDETNNNDDDYGDRRQGSVIKAVETISAKQALLTHYEYKRYDGQRRSGAAPNLLKQDA